MERLKGSGNALSRFPAAGHPKNLVPSPRNDNRMDGCALDLRRISPFFKKTSSFVLEFHEAVSSPLSSNLLLDIRYRLDLGFRVPCISNMSVRRSMNRWEGRRPRTEAFLETESKERERRRESETRRDVGRFRNDITTRVKWRGKLAQLLMDIAEKARQVLPEAGDRGGGGETRPIREKFSSRRIASRAVSRFVAKP